MSEYRIVTKDELYHARSHKYKKREWINGRWRYWYPEIKEGGRYGRDLGNRKIASDAYRKWAEQTQRNIVQKDMRITALNVLKKSNNLSDWGEQDLKDLQKWQNADKRNYAALMQQANRVENANRHNKKLSTKLATVVNRAKKWTSNIITTKTTITPATAKRKKKGKSWLSKILTTEKTTNHHMFGTDTTFRR